ncbi:MAG: DsrE family protein [Betaproteobacteria bacterium]|nr:DsrE family protein [Betaproteobacteria bacterium]
MIRSIGKSAAAAAVMFAVSGHALAEPTSKVVYHINEGIEHAVPMLRNVNNHLNAESGAKIVVVGHGKGIDFMLNGAKDKNGNPFDVTIDTLQAKGVEFRVCNNTLVSRKIDPKTVISQAHIVPSGVAEIGRLQAKEGYVYLKP